MLVETLKECGYIFQEFLLTPLQLGIPNSRMRYYLLVNAAAVMMGGVTMLIQLLIFFFIRQKKNQAALHIPQLAPSLALYLDQKRCPMSLSTTAIDL